MEKEPRTHKIIGACMEVHNEMGPGHFIGHRIAIGIKEQFVMSSL